MSIYDKIQDKIKQKLSQSPSQTDIPKFVSTILEDFDVECAFHQADLQTIKQPTLMFTQLTVQDIRENCYMYPFVVEKPFCEKSKTFFFGYGHKQVNFNHELLEDPNYFSYLTDRQTISCMPIVGETQWVKQVQKSQIKENKTFQMLTDKLGLFKLGEVFSAICLYEPQQKLLYFIRKPTDEQIKKWTNVEQYLNKQINFQEARNKLLNIFNQLYSEKYSQYLLYSFLATDHFFVSGFQNHSALFRKLLPRVKQVKIQAPFNESFFPYKNQEDHLVRTKMQLSNLQTFVVLDFSNLCSNQQVKIGPEEIDNLKALKVFVQQGNTIYRWAYGESQIKHNHTGVIVRASSIVSPQYVIVQPQDKQSKNEIPQISSQDLRTLRAYIQQVRKLNPIIKDDLKQIENAIHSQTKKFNETALVKVMQLSKLNAKSYGRDQIKLTDFENSCSLFF